MARYGKGKSRSLGKSTAVETAFGLLMGAVALGVIGAVAGVCVVLGGCFPTPLPADLCPPTGPTGYLAIVIDTTDKIGSRAQKEVERVLEASVNGLPVGTKLGLYLVVDETGDNPDGAARVTALCRPASGADVNIWLESKSEAEEVFQSGFVAPVRAELSGMLDVEAANTSPIVEAIQLATTDLLPFGESDAPRKIIVVSDMIQNSERFSFFRGDKWEDTKGESREALGIPLAGSRVEIVRVLRPGFWDRSPGFDTDDVNLFWRELLAAGGASEAKTIARIPAD
ncbi:MAG: hypothetical protein AB3N22_00390 [Ruegeria sp.]